MSIGLIRFLFAAAFFAIIGAGMLLGLGDLNKLDTVGDWFIIAGFIGVIFGWPYLVNRKKGI